MEILRLLAFQEKSYLIINSYIVKLPGYPKLLLSPNFVYSDGIFEDKKFFF